MTSGGWDTGALAERARLLARYPQPSVAAELAPEFDRLRRDVASWWSAVAPCLDCGHVRGVHDVELSRCWSPTGSCTCLGMVTSAGHAADRGAVGPADTPGAPT